jgi:hypothetical protein
VRVELSTDAKGTLLIGVVVESPTTSLIIDALRLEQIDNASPR